MIGFLIGITSFPLLAMQIYEPALFLIILNRVSDGLDGAVARQPVFDDPDNPEGHNVTAESDLGGYLDIVTDFIFYSGVIFFFALGRPEFMAHAAFLIFSFIGTGSSFLAYAIIAAKRGMDTEARGKKSFFHMGGLAEGSETILVLVLICLIPDQFPIITAVFGIMCWLTTFSRISQASRDFG